MTESFTIVIRNLLNKLNTDVGRGADHDPVCISNSFSGFNYTRVSQRRIDFQTDRRKRPDEELLAAVISPKQFGSLEQRYTKYPCTLYE